MKKRAKIFTFLFCLILINSIIACTDSDSGPSQFFEKGTTMGGNGNFTDECDGDSVIEYLCSSGSVIEINQECENGCEDGECKQGCAESDNGANIYEKGRIEIGNTYYEDYCRNSNENKILIEFRCNTENIFFKKFEITCLKGCEDGECIQPTQKNNQNNESQQNQSQEPEKGISFLTEGTNKLCKDSDNGKTIYEKGYVEATDGAYEDSCKNQNTLIEYTCNNGTTESSEEICENICENGECIQPTPETNQTQQNQSQEMNELQTQKTGFLQRIRSWFRNLFGLEK
jgi:hypothetical protein